MNKFEHPIHTVMEYVLGEWAMMLVEPAESPEEAFPAEGSFYCASAEYEGVFNGSLTLVCQRPFLDTLAGNVLGLQPDEIEPDTPLDALRELANIVSGNFLTEAYGTDTVFDLPSFDLKECTREGAAKFWQGDKVQYLQKASACYLGDDEPIFACFDIRPS